MHPQLEADTATVCRLQLCELLRMNDRQYPWVILVPRRAGVREIHRLEPEYQQLLWQEISAVSAALETRTRADKMNVAALGNMVPQLHVHIIARFTGDPAWPGPVWGKHPPRPFSDEDLVSECSQLASAFADL
ncbi:MAG: HIT family protein [Gammaproteobacteria bacterium]|nr:HIT family protein [Gammaproteobacteria bacterium]